MVGVNGGVTGAASPEQQDHNEQARVDAAMKMTTVYSEPQHSGERADVDGNTV